MPGEENILLSGEFEGKGIATGVDAAVAKLEQLRDQQRLNKEEIKDLNVALKANETEFKKQEAVLAKILPISKQNIALIEETKTKLEGLRQANVAMSDSLKKGEADLRKNTVAINEQSKAVNKMKREAEVANVAIRKFTSVNQLAAQGIGQLRGQLISAGTAMITGFAGGLIATVIPTIIEMVARLVNWKTELTELEKKQKIAIDIQKKAVEGYSGEVTKLEIIRAKLNDANIKQSDRITLAKEYNKIADEGNKIDVKQIDNLDLVNSKITQQIDLIKKRAIAKAFENILAEKAETLVKSQIDLQTRFPDIVLNEAFIDNLKKFGEGALTPEQKQQILNQLKGDPFALIKEANKFIEANADFTRTLEVGLNLIDVAALTTKGKAEPDKKGVENVYAQKLAELKARLAAVSVKSFQSEPLIEAKFAAQLDKEFKGIEKLLKDKKLTGPQADILKGLLKDINDIELSKGLEEFRKKSEEALRKVNDAIIGVQIENANKRIANIRDEFEREQAQIDQNYQNAVIAIKKRSSDLLRQINADTEKGLISPEVAKRKKFIATLIFGDLLSETEQARVNSQLDLAFRKFQDTIKENNALFDELIVQNDEDVAATIQTLKHEYASGAITFKQFQEEVTKALKKGKEDRDKIRLAELKFDLATIDARLKVTTDANQKQKLEEQQRNIRSQIADINTQVDTKDDPNKGRIDELIKYAKAVADLLGTIADFWSQVNAIEQASLERSIALQEKRVANAREIADKGNAEYLELEQKRLDELQRKHEDNARKQIAINNALTLSQATVAAISAIAQAVQTGTALAAFAAVASVIGAIGAAYAFVNSLQPQAASFYEGEEYVRGRKPGKDTVPAKLNIGERIVTTQDNKDYWETLTAIHNHLVPPGVLNSFVEAYPNINVPLVDYKKLSEATNGKFGADSFEVLDKLEGVNEKLVEVVQGISKLGINVSMDEDGFEVSITKAAKRRRLRSKA